MSTRTDHHEHYLNVVILSLYTEDFFFFVLSLPLFERYWALRDEQTSGLEPFGLSSVVSSATGAPSQQGDAWPAARCV